MGGFQHFDLHWLIDPSGVDGVQSHMSNDSFAVLNRHIRTLRIRDMFRQSSYSGGVAAQLLTAAIRIPVELLVPIAIGRFLGPTAVGSYAMILVVSTYVGYVADFGISYLLIREIARYSMQIKSWVS